MAAFATNDFTVENTSSFVSILRQFDNNANSYFMCSFDVTNLYTNIPLQETIDIILNYMFFSTNNVVLCFSRKLFSDLFQLAVLNSFFVSNQKLFRQIEGLYIVLGMGLPLAPTLANIFYVFTILESL